MIRKSSRLSCALLGLSALLIGSPSVWADMMHLDVMGSTVTFTQISEGSPSGDALPLYDQPLAVGDELVFAPTGGFSANSVGGGASDTTDGKLRLTITAKPGNFLDVLNIEEIGLTLLNAPFGGDAFASVNALAVIQVLQVNGQPIAMLPMINTLVFSPQNDFQHSVDATGPSYASAWSGTLSVDLPDLTEKVLLTVDNILFAATSGLGTGALIDKKGFSISVETGIEQNDVPEPATLALALVSLCGMVGGRRW